MTQSFINPLSKFTSDTLATLPYSRLYFFENESSTPKEVFKNQAKSVSWGTYATSDSAGNFAPIWFDGIVRAELRNSAGVVQTGWPIDHIGSDVSFDDDITVNGNVTADNLISLGGVEADSASGFITTDYTLDARNPIWSFGNASTYGISYFAGAPSIGTDDVIAIHFGTATELGAEFLFDQNGNFTAAGDVTGGDDLIVTDDASVGGDLAVAGSVTAASVAAFSATGTVMTTAGVELPNIDSAIPDIFDYYLEGTFNPAIGGLTSGGVGTYTTQTGKYTRIGNIVYFYAKVVWTAHTGTGDMSLRFLPFTSAINGVCHGISGSNLNFGGSAYSPYLAYAAGSAQMSFMRTLLDGSGAASGVPIDTAGEIEASGFYFV